ncbi:MAG: AraC family transcriptional regulator [Myxococcota bacterium]
MKPETRSFYQTAVQRAVETIVSDLDRALDLRALAREAALSPFHFHRIFKGMLGETPLELQRRLRMERASWSLLHEGSSVTAVAFAAGYETHESFTRAFRAHYACSPSEFRQSLEIHKVDCTDPFRVELAARSGIHFQPQRSEPPTIRFNQGEETMNIEIKDMQEMRVATVRHVGPYTRISEAFGRLGELAGKAGLFGPESAMIGIYHDDPESTPAAELRADAALVVPSGVSLPEELGEQRIPAGRYACTTHVGPYRELGDVWARFMGGWLPDSGHRLGPGECYEIYHNAPGEVPEDQLRTELYVPLQA